jgi:ParB-like chromosome segregation protein Spo0J
MGHARALLGLERGGTRSRPPPAHVVAKGLSVRATEALVRSKHGDPRPPRPAAPRPAPPAGQVGLGPRSRGAPDPGPRRAGRRSTRTAAPPQGGTITIRYLDLDHLDRLLDKLLVE